MPPPPQSSQLLGICSLARRFGHIWNAIRFHLLEIVQTNQWKSKNAKTFYISSLSKLSPVINQSRMHEFNTFICMRSAPSPAEPSAPNWEWVQALPCAYSSPTHNGETYMQRLCKLPLRQLHSSVSEKLGQIVALPYYFYYIDRCSWLRLSIFPFYFFSSFTARCSPFRCLQLFKSCSTVAVVVVVVAAARFQFPSTCRWLIR